MKTETVQYAKKLEEKLISNFREEFRKKLGYYPSVLTSMSEEKKDQIPLMSLEMLEVMLDPFMPTILGVRYTLKTKRKYKEITEIRMVFCYLAKQMRYSYNTIGIYLSGRHHTTILHNVRTFCDLYDTDEIFKQKYDRILRHIIKINNTKILQDDDASVVGDLHQA